MKIVLYCAACSFEEKKSTFLHKGAMQKPLGEGTGFNHGELMCKTGKWLNFRKLLTAFPALGNIKIAFGLGHFIYSPEG